MKATDSGRVAKAEPSDRTVLLKGAYRWANAERRYDRVDGSPGDLVAAFRKAQGVGLASHSWPR